MQVSSDNKRPFDLEPSLKTSPLDSWPNSISPYLTCWKKQSTLLLGPVSKLMTIPHLHLQMPPIYGESAMNSSQHFTTPLNVKNCAGFISDIIRIFTIVLSGITFIPILQMRKIRLRDDKSLVKACLYHLSPFLISSLPS